MDLLEPTVQPYAWGSRRIIADLQGRSAPTPGPEAELWMGAHPAAPAGLTRHGKRTTLDRLVERAPRRELGAQVSDRFERRLPFLLKVLAAEKALSIQVHPDRETARLAYRAERERGLSADDPERNYSDDWPKPEIVCALTPFEALAGMREPGEAAGVLRALRVEALAPVVQRLDDSDDAGLVEVLRTLLSWPPESRGDLLTRVIEACDELAHSDGEHAGAYRAVVRAAADHPGDLGAVATLLLNHTILQPGEGLYLAAGGLHAYLRGAGVEILANSDNVLRAGLTGKRIDLDELCRIVDPAVGVPILRPEPDADGVRTYAAPVPEFRLYRVERAGGTVQLPGEGPRIVFNVEGVAQLSLLSNSPGLAGDVDGGLSLQRGESAYLSAADGPVQVSGAVTLFVACPGDLTH
ncbi:MAG: mannose-6-phosphate isomerase, class I [Micrococcales bacterium]|nr:mannose-6-phosphate isomerase, class I [Micrococcales bacterium]